MSDWYGFDIPTTKMEFGATCAAALILLSIGFCVGYVCGLIQAAWPG